MSYLKAAPEFLASAGTDLSNIGAALNAGQRSGGRTIRCLFCAADIGALAMPAELTPTSWGTDRS
jgi:hypothetical protein